jgi:hypothetical protein
MLSQQQKPIYCHKFENDFIDLVIELLNKADTCIDYAASVT